MNSFVKNFPKKLIPVSRHSINTYTLIRQKYKEKIYAKNVRKIYVGSGSEAN
jgi:hypothetical protein